MWISGGPESRTADLPGYACFLQCKVVIWADVGVGLEISPNLKTVRNPSGSNREKTETRNFSLSGPPWIHPGGYLTTCDIYCEGSLTQDQGSPSHGHLKNPTNWSITPAQAAHRFRPIFFELRPSENSGTVEWNKRPLLFI